MGAERLLKKGYQRPITGWKNDIEGLQKTISVIRSFMDRLLQSLRYGTTQLNQKVHEDSWSSH